MDASRGVQITRPACDPDVNINSATDWSMLLLYGIIGSNIWGVEHHVVESQDFPIQSMVTQHFPMQSMVTQHFPIQSMVIFVILDKGVHF